jgi:hypothetical protein
VLADGEVVGRIFEATAAPVGSPWMWDPDLRLPQGLHAGAHEATREAVMSLISLNVRNRGQAGPHLLVVSFSQFDPSLPFHDRFCCGAQQRSHATAW